MKIAVGLSGGVDSSVTAVMLKNAGHEVVGVTMKLWRSNSGYRGGAKDACFGPGEADDIARAEALCREFGIEYRVFDCAEAYEKLVLNDFRREYLTGHTPNPCVRCNAFVKFGVLPELARRSGVRFDKFATGHYARVRQDGEVFRLLKGVDETKDQSYFLYRLTQKQLGGLLLPLGGFRKSEVRALAVKFGLEAANQPDSQDFYSGDHAELLGVSDRPGNIVDAAGQVLGTHCGFWHYTIGQRRGLGVAAKQPLYVTGLVPCRNEVVVGPADETAAHRLILRECRWIAAVPRGDCGIKIRSAMIPAAATVEVRGESAAVDIPAGVSAPAPGQSAVLYRGDEVFGGGIITGD